MSRLPQRENPSHVPGSLGKIHQGHGRSGGVDYYFCDHCTVLFQYPIFDQAEYEKFYEKVQRI